jgi:cyclin C
MKPVLTGLSCLYIAAKVEECTTTARKIVEKIREKEKQVIIDEQKILASEFEIIKELEFYMIVHHPYRELQRYARLSHELSMR